MSEKDKKRFKSMTRCFQPDPAWTAFVIEFCFYIQIDNLPGNFWTDSGIWPYGNLKLWHGPINDVKKLWVCLGISTSTQKNPDSQLWNLVKEAIFKIISYKIPSENCDILRKYPNFA